jgi:hypothetical protein
VGGKAGIMELPGGAVGMVVSLITIVGKTEGRTVGASKGVEVGVDDGPSCIVDGSIAMSTEGVSVDD